MLEDQLIKFGTTIFTETFPVRVTHVELESIRQESEDIAVVEEYDLHNSESGVSFMTNSPNQQHIIDMMSGRPFLSGIESHDDRNLNTRFVKNLTINEMVELWSAVRTLRFVDLADVVTAFQTVKMYLEEITHMGRFQSNYRPPPEDDISKMESFINSIRQQKPGIEFSTDGNDDWSNLVRLFGGVSFGFGDENDDEDEEHAPIARMRRTPKPKAINEDNPFDILK